LLSEESSSETRATVTCDPSDPPPEGGLSINAWVFGRGPLAQAALIESLLACGEKAVAAKVGNCGAHPLPMAEYVEVVSRGKRKRHMNGLCHCGRFQVCPCCTPFIMAQRLEELVAVAEGLMQDPGLRFFMVTLTVRHRLGAHWKPLVDVLRSMVSSLRQGHKWRESVEGFVRLLETTYGRNGHHPHEHLVLTCRATPEWDPEPFFAWVMDRCKARAKKAGRSCDFKPGWWKEIDPVIGHPKLTPSGQHF
jgi:hypothetical protein